MRKRGLAPLLLVTALLTAGLTTDAGAAQRAVKVVDCRTGTATFEGTVRAVKGASRMAMRFQLRQQGSATDEPQAVKAPDLMPWRKSRAGVKEFTYSQTVKGLASGVTYSVLVKYRWFNAAGKVIKRAEQPSGTCVQDGSLPNLVLGSVKLSPGAVPGTAVYTVQVRNIGGGAAEGVSVTLISDGSEIDTQTIDRLEAGEFKSLKFTGPHCNRFRAEVDPGETIPETVESDNELRGRC